MNSEKKSFLIIIATAALFCTAAAQEKAEPLPQPAARWTFDSEFGLTEPDSAGIGPEALLVRDSVFRPLSRRVTGIFGRALHPEMRSLVKTSFPANEKFSFSIWIKPEKPDVSCFAKCEGVFSMSIDRNSPTLHCNIGKERISAKIELDKWLNIILRSDGTRASLFLDGIKIGEKPIAFSANTKGSDFIFSNDGGAHHQFEGLVDEVRIYDIALSDAQIAILADKEQCMAQLPPSVDPGICHSIYLPADSIKLEGKISGEESPTCHWSVIKAPKGANAKFSDPASAKTQATFDKTGEYVLALEAKNKYGKAYGTVRVAVFPPHEKKTGKLSQNHLKPGRIDSNAKGWGKEPLYDQANADKTFPEPVFKYHLKGFDKSRFSPPPPPYRHPRIFFNHSDLDDMRTRLKYTRAGQAAEEKIRNSIEMALRNSQPGESLSTYFRLKKQGEKNDLSDMKLGAIYCNMAFLAMIDADGETARRIIDCAVKTADDQLATIEKAPENRRTDWQNFSHGILARYTTSYIYDFLYPWMSDAERNKLRKVIAGCTAGKRAIGMFAVGGAHGSSNWVAWVTGDLLANVLSIEGEDGFDPVVYEEAKRAMLHFWSYGVYEDGSLFEGMGKNSITAQNLAALAKRGEYIIASDNIYNYATKFIAGTMQPYGYQFVEDDLWGGSRNGTQIEDIAYVKFAYPNDPVVDFIYRNAVGDDYNWKPKVTTYCYSNDLVMCWTASDWTGDKDWNKNAAQAMKGQPLSYFSNNINLVTARSAWNSDAAFIYFLPRMLGGHPSKARGTFVFSALGRDWSLYPTGHNDKASIQHSVIIVDGKSAGTQWARMLEFRDSGNAVFASCNLSDVYGRTANFAATLNDYRLVKGDLPWQSIPLNQLPHWYDGDKPSAPGQQPGHMIPPGRLSENEQGTVIPTAFRSVFFARGEKPFAVIVDDMDIDGKQHDYRWQMILPPELRKNDLKQDKAIVWDEATGKRLVVKLFANSDLKSSNEPLPENKKKQFGDLNILAFDTRGVSPGFTAVLLPLEKDESEPEIVLNGNRLKVGNTSISMIINEKGRRILSLK